MQQKQLQMEFIKSKLDYFVFPDGWRDELKELKVEADKKKASYSWIFDIIKKHNIGF